MRRLSTLLLATVLLVGLAACDRTDHEYGEDGAVRIGTGVEDLLTVPGTSDVVVIGRGRQTASMQPAPLQVSLVHSDGTTQWTERLPSTIDAVAAHGAVVVEEPMPNHVSVVGYVVGYDQHTGPGGELSVAAVRDGELDIDYGDGGVAATGIDYDSYLEPVATPIGNDGSLLVSYVGADGQLHSVRVSPMGAIESRANLGVAVSPRRSVVDAQGRVLLVGTIVTGATANGALASSELAVVRVLPSGALDGSFGVDGVATVAANDINSGQTIALRPDGRIIAGGTTRGRDNRPVQLVAGLTATGAPDSTFGLYGMSIVHEENDGEQGLAVGGPGFVLATSFRGDVITYGFTQSGTPEKSWGAEGRQLNRPTPGFNTSGGIVVTPERFVVGVRTSDAPGGALLGLKP